MNALSDTPECCQACGHEPSGADPLVNVDDPGAPEDGWWVHESHTTDERSGFYGEAVR